MNNADEKVFEIKYINENSTENGKHYFVREIEGFDHHYFISDGNSHVGGGRLLKKYCFKLKQLETTQYQPLK